VDIGDHVKKGDLLFKLDDKRTATRESGRPSPISRRRSSTSKRPERDYKRAKQLLDEKLIAQELF